MSHQGVTPAERPNEKLTENLKKLFKRVHFESDDKKDNGKINKKLRIKRMKQAIEEAAIDAIQKICKNKRVKRNKVTALTIKKINKLKPNKE